MLSVGLALHDPGAGATPADLAALRDLGGVRACATRAPQTAPGARAILGTSYAERLGALTLIEVRAHAGESLDRDMVECLLYLVATDPQHASEAAQLLPVQWWPVAVEALVHADEWWGLFDYLERVCAEGSALADAVFDHVEVLLDAAPLASRGRVESPEWAMTWWQRREVGRGSGDASGSMGVSAIAVGLSEQQVHLARAVSPSKATAFVRARYTSTGSGGLGGSGGGTSSDNSWAGLIARIDDPRMLRVLFDQQADLGYDLHLGYPYRKACLANPVLPVDLADLQVVDCGARPGPPRRQVKKVADGTCLDVGVEASRCASAEVVASTIWADPQRWWREIVAPPGKQPVRKPRHRAGTGRVG